MRGGVGSVPVNGHVDHAAEDPAGVHRWILRIQAEAGQFPPEYRPAVSPPPAGRETTAGALLHATPVGRAIPVRRRE